MQYSWKVTVLTQICLFAIAASLIAFMQFLPIHTESDASDLYFISVGDGPCTLADKMALLQQMEAHAEEKDVQFVVSSGNCNSKWSLRKMAEEAVDVFPSLKVPWYTSGRCYRDSGCNYFNKEIPISFQHKLEFIVIDTIELKDSIMNGSLNDSSKHQVEWLESVLEGSTSDWRVVIGQHPLNICDGKRKSKGKEDMIREIIVSLFTRHPVHGYLHGRVQNGSNVNGGDDADKESYVSSFSCCETSIAMEIVSSTDAMITKGLNNQGCSEFRNSQVGFILHRVSPFEMESYFVAMNGNIQETIITRQRSSAA